jgi:hypothetical protein
MHDLVQDTVRMQYSYPKSLQYTHFSYNRKVPIVTKRRGSSRTGLLQITEMQWFMDTVGKYVNVPNTTKFTQENQNGNRMRWEITPTKHRTLCLPQILVMEAVSKNTHVLRWKAGDTIQPYDAVHLMFICNYTSFRASRNNTTEQCTPIQGRVKWKPYKCDKNSKHSSIVL